MKIAIAGYSGFIGAHLCDFLSHRGHTIIKISRIDLERVTQLKIKLTSVDAVINLCGSSIFGNWSESGKQRILNSRVLPTRSLNSVINELNIKPKVFINASAVGVYDNKHIHDDDSKNYGDNFQSTVVNAWESEFFSKDIEGVRKVALRMGVVIDKRGGFFKRIYQFHKYGFLPVVSNDESAFPIVALTDLLRIYEFALTHSNLVGSVNAVLPMPVTSLEFYNKVRSYSPFLFVIRLQPKYLTLIFGKKIVVLTENPIVFPRKLLEQGFHFDVPEIDCYLKKLRG
jgi:uncharacterized protein (TIGR01777 family)